MASSSATFESSTKHHANALLLFSVLVLLFLPLFARPIFYFNPSSSPSSAAAAAASRQLLSAKSTKHKAPASSSFTTSAAAAANNATDREYRAAAHNVPSGPNPESN